MAPFESIFTILNGLNSRDFLDITFYLLIRQNRDLQEAIASGQLWYVDTTKFSKYVSGRSMKAWADLLSLELAQIGEGIKGSAEQSSFFFDFTDFRRYPLWRADEHRYFAI